MKKLFTLLMMLIIGIGSTWAYSTTTVTSAQDSKGNALVSGAFYRILLPSRGASVALQQNGDYVKANNGLGIIGFMWKIEEDANGKALISNPSGGYWKFTDYGEGNSKVKTNGTADDCTAFQMAWASSASKTLNLFDPDGGTYTYDNVKCGAVLSNHGGVNNNMGIYNNILDGGSIFKFERFYRTTFTVESTDVNGVAVENYPATVTINGNVTTAEYYTNSDNQITSFSTVYGAAYYIGGVEKTAEEVKAAINANTGTLTVTVKPKPFVASTGGSPAYYAIMISGNANSWWENTNGTVVNCGSGRAFPAVTNRAAWIWELKQNSTSGYKIYSVDADKYLGGRTATGGAFTLGDDASANSFKCYYNSGATIKFKDYTNNLWIDRATVNQIGQPYAHTSGQQITFLRMYKVTFSEAITVNSVDDITTIYVKSDGSDALTLPNDKVYSINGADPVGHADAATAIAACTSDLTITVSEITTKDVTYILKWSDGTTINEGVSVTTGIQNPAEEYVPAAFVNDFTTLSYSPEKITKETDEVIVTATWNGPMQITDTYDAGTAKWYTVGIHTSYEDANHIWKYNSSDETIGTEAVATYAYGSITDNHLFCFVGNPYQGLSIYNKATGNSKTLYHKTPSSYGDPAYMAAEGIKVFPKASSASGKTVANGYACFLYGNDGTNNWYLNCNAGSSYGIYGWNSADAGSTCWFIVPSQYPYNYLDSYGDVWAAPAGAVGTKDVDASIWANAGSAKAYLAANPFYYADEDNRNSTNLILNALDAAETVTLGDGYYRVVSAVPGFNNTAAWYYNPSTSTDHITWAKVATTTEHQVNSIFKFTANDDKWNIYSPNAQAYLIHDNTAFSAQTGTIGATAGDVTIENLTSTIQYKLYINVQGVHANGHSSGSGSAGTLINYNADANSASAWYIVKVDELKISLNNGGDGNYYATLCLPFDVTINEKATAYTLAKSGDWLVPTAVEDNKVPAGTPVLLKGTSASATATINTGSAFNSGAPLTCALTGTYLPKTIAGSTDYVLGKKDKVGFYHWSSNNLAANRAYLAGSSNNARGFALMFDDDATGIVATPGETEEGTTIYNLSGQRLNKMQKGINIVNGKKVLF